MKLYVGNLPFSVDEEAFKALFSNFEVEEVTLIKDKFSGRSKGFGFVVISDDEAAKKATRFMIDYLVDEHSLERNDAYMLCSLAGDLKIAEVVDVPHVLVTMHMSKKVLGIKI